LREQILSAWNSGTGGVEINWLVADQLGTPQPGLGIEDTHYRSSNKFIAVSFNVLRMFKKTRLPTVLPFWHWSLRSYILTKLPLCLRGDCELLTSKEGHMLT
jgi:hypothetical protein